RAGPRRHQGQRAVARRRPDPRGAGPRSADALAAQLARRQPAGDGRAPGPGGDRPGRRPRRGRSRTLTFHPVAGPRPADIIQTRSATMLDKNFRPAEVETKQYADWERRGAFAGDPDSNARPFTIMMPPPNVTGSLHIGHALT